MSGHGRRLEIFGDVAVEVIRRTGERQGTSNLWLCRCRLCGKEFVTRASRIRGLTSCGCHAKTKEHMQMMTSIQHKDSPQWRTRFPREHAVFFSARHRCKNPNNQAYSRYGGRGIEFRFKSFQEFIEYLGPRPSDLHSLDRINPDGHYEIGNVRWATQQEQTDNRICRCTCEECRAFRAEKYRAPIL